VRTEIHFSQNHRYSKLDTERSAGRIPRVQAADSKDGDLAVFYGNLVNRGCIVKSAGVGASMPRFRSPEALFEVQAEAVDGILNGRRKAGQAVLIRYEEPRGGPRDAGDALPDESPQIHGLGKACALSTDRHFSGGTGGLSSGHVPPEDARGQRHRSGTRREGGGFMVINIPARAVQIALSDTELRRRRANQTAQGWTTRRP
jgi:dihydroxy-acid dehydratase